MRNDFQQLQALLLINTEEIHAVRVDGERRRVKEKHGNLATSAGFICTRFVATLARLHSSLLPSFIPRQPPRCSGVVADSQSLFTESVRQAASGVRLCVPDIFADCFQSTRFRIPVTLRSDRKGEETMKRPLSGSWSMMRLLACTHLLEHVGNQEKEEGKERKKRGIKSERKI